MSNVGTLDRILRSVIGLALIIAPLLAAWPTLALMVSVLVGVVLLGTATVGFCPIYAALSLSSKRPTIGRT